MKLKSYEYMHLKASIDDYKKQAANLREDDGSAQEWQEVADNFCEAVACLVRRLDSRINEKIMDKIND